MKKIGLLFLTVSMVLLVAGCSTMKPVSHPDANVNLIERDYEILGRVEYSGTAHNILGMAWWGGAQYRKLYEKAQKEFGADDVINITVDSKRTIVGIFYNSKTYVMTGQAIKYK